MGTWQENLIKQIEVIMWSQWVTLGAYMAGRPCEKSVVDPEALVVATCALARGSSRIFDEAMDWTARNHAVLKGSRLKRIAKEFKGDTFRALGAFLEFISQTGGKTILPGVRAEAEKSIGRGGTEELFWLQKGMFAGREKEADPLFLRWGFLRGTPRMRGHSLSPDTGNPANLMVRAREYYGMNARADIITFLLTEKGGSSNGIAVKTKYDQAVVYRALEDLVSAGIVKKHGQVRMGYYWLDREDVASSMGIGGTRPVYFVWGDIYRALDLISKDEVVSWDVDGGGLKSIEAARELTTKVTPLIRNAGEPLSHEATPDISRQAGKESISGLKDYVSKALNIIRSFVVEER